MIISLGYLIWGAINCSDLNISFLKAYHHGKYINLIYYREAFSLLIIFNLCLFLKKKRIDGEKIFNQIKTYLPIRLLLYLILLTIAVTSIKNKSNYFEGNLRIINFYFNNMLMLFVNLWLMLIILKPEEFSKPLKGIAGISDVVFTNIMTIIIIAEIILSIWALHSNSILFWDVNSIQSSLNKLRVCGNQRNFNFNLNSKGYHDYEFFKSEKNDFVVALLSDSFGFSIVPYEFNFATIAENKLKASLKKEKDRIAVHNFSISGIGMLEYAYLLKTEVPLVNPQYVALCVFVGNDIESVKEQKLNKLYSFKEWWLWIVSQRMYAVISETSKGANVTKIGKPIVDDQPLPPHLFDDSLEIPTFTKEKYLFLERDRLSVCDIQSPEVWKRYSLFFDVLSLIHKQLGDKLIVVVIPDEFQVNDELYKKAISLYGNPQNIDRDYPQARIKSYCEQNNINMLDLLPYMRYAAKKQRPYHLQDTHFNAYGNKIAGETIANYIINVYKNDSK